MKQILFVMIGSGLGACFRWGLGIKLNHLFPSIPLGTLAANLSGCFFMGCVMLIALEHSVFRKDILIGITAGFLGSMTTFSTFSAEAFYLLNKREYALGGLIIFLHVAGSIVMTGLGFFTTKALIKLGG
jgi:fluoride exporter